MLTWFDKCIVVGALFVSLVCSFYAGWSERKVVDDRYYAEHPVMHPVELPASTHQLVIGRETYDCYGPKGR